MRREGVFMDRFEVSNYMIISVIRWLSASAPISIKSVLQNVRIYHRVHHFSSMTPISSARIVFYPFCSVLSDYPCAYYSDNDSVNAQHTVSCYAVRTTSCQPIDTWHEQTSASMEISLRVNNEQMVLHFQRVCRGYEDLDLAVDVDVSFDRVLRFVTRRILCKTSTQLDEPI